MKKTFIALLLSVILTVPAFALDYNSPEIIKQVQEALNAAGYDCGTPDGIAGSATNGQIEKYRADKGLEAGNSIDDVLYDSLFPQQENELVEEPYEFAEITTEEEIASIPDVQVLALQVAYSINNLGLGKCEFISFGNLFTVGQIVNVSAKYITEAGKPVVFVAFYSPFDNPSWTISYVVNADNSHYYYIAPVFEGDYDVYDYVTEEVIIPAVEVYFPTEEEVAEEERKKAELEEATRSIIASKVPDTDIRQISVNRSPEGDYLVLPYLTWNIKNSKKLTNTMLEKYSLIITKELSDAYPEISEIACFWKVPYISDTQSAKFQYFRKDGVMYIGDYAIGWGS